MNKKDCENCYEEYQKLRERTKWTAHEKKYGEKVEAQNIPSKDLERLDKTRKKLKDCFGLLSKEELIEISGDEEIGEDAREFLKRITS